MVSFPKEMPRCLALWVLLGIAGLSYSPAQDANPKPLTESLITTLHHIGLPASEILGSIEKNGLAEEFDSAALKRLEHEGVARAVLQRLRREVERRGAVQITVSDIVAMHDAGIPIPIIRGRIVASPSKVSHDADDIVRMASHGVPSALIRAMREHDPDKDPSLDRDDGQLTIKDLIAMAATGLSRDQMLDRIRRSDASFEIVIDDLIQLSREGVPQEVVNEVWARRVIEAPPGTSKPDKGERPANSVGESTSGYAQLLIHREPAGPFSLVVPAGWHAFRDSSGRNELLSLTDRPVSEDTSLADTEIQILRVRAKEDQVDRLVPQNLDSIAKNFVLRLQANYASKRMSLRAGQAHPTTISGQPAIVHRLASTDSEGTTHEGELAVTFHGGQVYIISYAIRADMFADRSETLSAALRSFTFETERADIELAAEPREQLRKLFEIWRDAIKSNDYARFRQLLPEDDDSADRRMSFVSQVQRLNRANLKLQLGTLEVNEATGEGRVHCRVIAPKKAETVVISFKRTQRGFKLE